MKNKIEEIKKFLKRVIWDYSNNNCNISEINVNTIEHIFEGKYGDSKFFENYLEWFDEYSQSIKSETNKEWVKKIDIVISTHLTGKSWQEQDVLLREVKEQLLQL